jgi:fatty-acyl-CoA synthase
MNTRSHIQSPTFSRALTTAFKRYASRPAVGHQGVTWTFAQLERRITELAGGLQRAGLKPGDPVGMLGRNTLDYAALQLALPLFGMPFMSLYELEGTQSHLGQIEYGQLRAVVIDPDTAPGRLEELAPALGKDVMLLSLTSAESVPSLSQLAASAAPVPVVPSNNPDQIVELGLTGGTTGTAKAVVDTESVYINQAVIHAANWELPRDPRMLLSTPLSHAIASVGIKTVLLLGGSVVLQSQFSPPDVLAAVESERINSVLLVPSAIYRLLDCEDIARRDLSSLELLLYGGSPMSPDRAAEAIDRLGAVLQQQYGGRENKTVTVLGKRDHDPARPDLLASAGTACLGVELVIMDASMNELPPGEMGEICTRSPANPPGYWNRPEDTAELHKGGWVHSGDLGVMDESGYVTVKDRIKQVIISGGHNVVSRDVEDAIAAHPGIAAVAVFGVPDPQWGEAVKAAVSLRPDAAVTDVEIMEFVRARMGSVNTPKSVDIHPELPLTTAGKIDKKQLRQPYWEGQLRSVG